MACDTPFWVGMKGGKISWTKERGYTNTVPVPCGKCPDCRKRKINQWVFRMLQEEKRSESAYFVTLTYAPEMLRRTYNNFATLYPDHCTLFMKKLRKRNKAKIKYYLVGEYGSKTMRPHYHAIIFNLEDPEYVVKSWTERVGDKMVQLGSVHVGKVTGASISYTCKYIDKDTKIPIHKYDDRVKEFSRMSKGIGSNYLTEQVKSYHRRDLSRVHCRFIEGHYVAMPRYYRDQIYSEAEKKKQRVIFDAKEKERQEKLREDYNRKWKGKENLMSFEHYCDSIRKKKYLLNKKNIRNESI